MEFESQDYILRKPELNDANGFIDICNDSEVMKYYGTSGIVKTLDDAKKQIEWCYEQFSNNAGRWIITQKSKNIYIGDIGFFNFIQIHNKVEIGYKLCKEFWGKGIILNFIKILINYGFTELNYNRIEAMVDIRNIGSKKVLLKNQFQLEGTLRDYEFEYNNYVDLEIYSILKRDHLS